MQAERVVRAGHCHTTLLGRHKARCVAVRLLMPPVENRTYHFHGIRLNTCGPSPCSHEAFLSISPTPQGIPRGQLARALGTFGPVFPQARGLRHPSSSWCTRLSRVPTTMPHPTLPEGIGFSLGSRLPTLHSPSHPSARLPCSVGRTQTKRRRWRVAGCPIRSLRLLNEYAQGPIG